MTTKHQSSSVPGQFTFVLHSHLPWLPNHGRWPVGEEWLYQSWAASYLPVFALLRRLANDGLTNQLTMGITPVLAAQLDDPHSLNGMYSWLADWQLRAHEAALVGKQDAVPGSAHTAAALHKLGAHEHRAAAWALSEFENHWRHGGSAMIRRLLGSNVFELLGGPLAHPFQPLLASTLRSFSLNAGLTDTLERVGKRPSGIWAPECAYKPGMEKGYALAGVEHFMVDGPSLRGDTALGRPVGTSDVVAFGRDLQVSYQVWSPKSGYPGHKAYRDFHTYNHTTGLKPARVTGKGIDGQQKRPYEPTATGPVIAEHVDQFVSYVRERMINESARLGRPALVVAAFDTELFGHWWHEGPQWLEGVLRALPEAGISVGTLATARKNGYVGDPVDLPVSSWGSGKDWRVWNGEKVHDLVQLNSEVVDTALTTVKKILEPTAGFTARNPVADQIIRETLLTVMSDWPFMVSKDTAAGYARDRAHKHAHATREICAAADSGHWQLAAELAHGWRQPDNLFASLDARQLFSGAAQ